MSGSLPSNPRHEDEVNILSRKNELKASVPQTIPFTDLPAEIRNRIYELALPSAHRSDELITATPVKDEVLLFATQPVLTRVSHQLRAETLEMFYANNTFVAYIARFDFLRLIHWVRCITSGRRTSQITVHVKLLDRIIGAYDLLDITRDWRDLEHDNIHLKIHNCYAVDPPHALSICNQRELAVKAIRLAEDLHREGDSSEDRLLHRYIRDIAECFNSVLSRDT